MNLTISGHHLEITPAIREHVKSKLDRITRRLDNVIDISVILGIDTLPEKEKRQKAEININLSGKTMHVESVSEDMYAAIDTVIDKLDRKVLKHKEKIKDHPRDSIKHIPEPTSST